MSSTTEAPQNRVKSGRARTQFKPGQSGNPGGRPKTAEFAEEVRVFLGEKNAGKTRLRQILEGLQKNDPKILLYYAYGKPGDTMDMQVETQTTIAGMPEEFLAAVRAKAAKF